MKLCRFKTRDGRIGAGWVTDETTLLDLTPAGVRHLHDILESPHPVQEIERLSSHSLPRIHFNEVHFLSPIEHQEVWAAGVTYLRSKKARMEESDFSASAYDRVYEAPRPEIFFKSLPGKVIGPGDPVGIRQDAHWNVPEPELTLAINSRGQIAGYTIGNDMSSRDIEGENALYLPQAKVYHRSCAMGPFIRVGPTESQAREWTITLEIQRNRALAFEGETSVSQIKRRFPELVEYLFRSQKFPHGAFLLTGTGIVPPDGFTLEEGDVVTIRISGIGQLTNPVVRV